MRRAGASLLVGGNTNLVVYQCVCMSMCSHTHACERERETNQGTGEKEKGVRAQRPIKFLLAF